MRLTRRECAALLVHSGMAPGSRLQTRGGSAPLVWTPDTIAWQPDETPGAKYAVLYGNRDEPDGVSTYAFWLPGGVWAPVHRHSQTAHVAVMRGTLRLGLGRVADRAKAVRVAAGEFFVVPANGWHFEGSDSECLIVGTAQGGWTTTVAP